MTSSGSSDFESEKARWTLPKRTALSGENLHISDFLLLKNGAGDSMLLLRAGQKHPVPFKRNKLLLPATILTYGESPRFVAKKLVSDQLSGVENLKLDFVSMQSYLGAHWDIVFIYGASIDEKTRYPSPKPPFVELNFYKLSDLPRDQISEDHLEVLDQLRKEELEEKEAEGKSETSA